MNMSLSRNPYGKPKKAVVEKGKAAAAMQEEAGDSRKLQLSGFGGSEWSPQAAIVSEN